MRFRPRGIRRFVGGSLHGETIMCDTRLVYFRADDHLPAGFEEYERDGRHYVFVGTVAMRNPGMGASTTLERRPATMLVPV